MPGSGGVAAESLVDGLQGSRCRLVIPFGPCSPLRHDPQPETGASRQYAVVGEVLPLYFVASPPPEISEAEARGSDGTSPALLRWQNEARGLRLSVSCKELSEAEQENLRMPPRRTRGIPDVLQPRSVIGSGACEPWCWVAPNGDVVHMAMAQLASLPLAATGARVTVTAEVRGDTTSSSSAADPHARAPRGVTGAADSTSVTSLRNEVVSLFADDTRRGDGGVVRASAVVSLLEHPALFGTTTTVNSRKHICLRLENVSSPPLTVHDLCISFWDDNVASGATTGTASVQMVAGLLSEKVAPPFQLPAGAMYSLPFCVGSSQVPDAAVPSMRSVSPAETAEAAGLSAESARAPLSGSEQTGYACMTWQFEGMAWPVASHFQLTRALARQYEFTSVTTHCSPVRCGDDFVVEYTVTNFTDKPRDLSIVLGAPRLVDVPAEKRRPPTTDRPDRDRRTPSMWRRV